MNFIHYYNHFLEDALEPFLEGSGITPDILYKKYKDKKLAENDFHDIIRTDPTAQYDDKGEVKQVGKYADWLIRIYLNKKMPLEDLSQAKEYLTIFNKKKQVIDASLRDINKYKSLPELYKMIRDNKLEEHTSQGEVKKEIKEGAEDINLIYEDENWKVVQPLTKAASCYWGSNTQWCTASRGERNYFDDYAGRGPLYIFIDKKNPKSKYQLHVGNGIEFNDESNDEYSLSEFFTQTDTKPMSEALYNKLFRKEIQKHAKSNTGVTVKTTQNGVILTTDLETLTEYININLEHVRDYPSTKWISETINDGYFSGMQFDSTGHDLSYLVDEIHPHNITTIKNILSKDVQEKNKEKFLDDLDDSDNLLEAIEGNNGIADAIYMADVDTLESDSYVEFHNDVNKSITSEGWKYDTKTGKFSVTINAKSYGLAPFIALAVKNGFGSLFTNDRDSDEGAVFNFELQEPRYGWSDWTDTTFNTYLEERLGDV